MDKKYVITISHLLGSGGAIIGKKISDMLSVPFVDRQILKQVADYLNIPEEDIEDREERVTSFWQSFIRLEAFGNPMTVNDSEFYLSDRELFKLESEFIEQIVDKSSAIILGRCGRYILQNYQRHFSVFIYADINARIHRVSELFHVPENESKKIIEKNDRERESYIKAFTRLEWLNLRTYDLCINTSSIGIDNTADIIKNSLKYKLDNCTNSAGKKEA